MDVLLPFMERAETLGSVQGGQQYSVPTGILNWLLPHRGPEKVYD